MPSHSVQYIGSRELHRALPRVLDTLGDSNARVVLTVHSKPKAVLIGAEAFQALLQRASAEDRLLALQLGAIAHGLREQPVGPAGQDDEIPLTADESPAIHY